MIKLMQEWKWTSIMPPELHDWNMFIKPQELDELMRKNHLQSQDIAGIVPQINPLKMVFMMRGLKKGKLDYNELRTRTTFRKGEDISINYMGYALKSEVE